MYGIVGDLESMKDTETGHQAQDYHLEPRPRNILITRFKHAKSYTFLP